MDAVILRLHEDQLLSLVEGERVVAAQPAAAVERLISKRLRKLNDEVARTAGARSVIPSLIEDQQHGDLNRESPLDIERLESVAEVRARIDDLAFFTHREVLAFQPDGPLTPALIEAARPLDLRALRRGISLRTVVLTSATADPATGRYLRELTQAGAEIRAVEQRMERLLVFDRSVAVVPVDPADSSRGALIVRQAGLVSHMIELFNQVWNAAAPLAEGDDPAGSEEQLSTNELMVLRILTEVEKDEVGARQMGISVRTFRRYVADVMLRLGAANRFQVAIMARERGWI
ncbi:LuxR C-terminal-related transcriptional regulator [Kitasatospora sp. NPDC058190]|uniref:LuxR C-terminal-related transcriptional regulator n=1 Tax=Kitasatospora sp. NPDC058190 TaxID=3346371 RepID=UPI0036D8C772